MKILLVLACSISLYGQITPLVINPGNMNCTGVVQSDPAWSTDTTFQTVQVSQRMTCKVTVKPGLYNIVIRAQEPLVNAFAGIRVFNVTVNGLTVNGVDLFKLAGGAQIPYEINILQTANSQLTITFEATTRTALWSQILIQPNGQ